MFFLKAELNQYNLIKDFLVPYESTCVLLSSYVRKNDSHIFIASEFKTINSSNQISAVFYIHGTFLHCFPEFEKYKENQNFKNDFFSFISDKKIKVVSGETLSSDFFLQLLSEKNQIPFQSISYKMYSLEEKIIPPPVKLINDEEIRRCTENDFDSLKEIQKQYLLKEVVPQGKTLTDLELNLNLKQILKSQVVLCLYTDDQIVSKANSNAIGWNYVQIGGVFTNPLFRRNYYSWQVIYNLSLRILNSKRKVCLFVKEKNSAAISLYEKIGFKRYANYKISYFN